MHHAGSFIALVSLPVMLEVMRITRHGDLDLVFSEKAVDCDERFAFASVVNNGCRTGLAPPFSCRWPFTSALVAAAGVKRMAQDGQGELSLGSAQSCLQPIPFVAVHGAQDTGVYGDQTESTCLYFEEWPALPAGAYAKFMSQPRRFFNHAINASVRRACQSLVCFHASAQARIGTIWLAEVR